MARTRVDIESTYGIWKRRFSCLGQFGPLRFRRPEMSCYVIQACAILQNFIMLTRLDEENDDHLYEEEEHAGERTRFGLEWEEPDEPWDTRAAIARLNSHKYLFKQLNNL